MSVDINENLLSIRLYSLLASFENFRYMVESRDELTEPEVLKVKIQKGYDATLQKSENDQLPQYNSSFNVRNF